MILQNFSSSVEDAILGQDKKTVRGKLLSDVIQKQLSTSNNNNNGKYHMLFKETIITNLSITRYFGAG